MSEPKRYRLSKEAREAGLGIGAITAFMIEEGIRDKKRARRREMYRQKKLLNGTKNAEET